jgi:segregation and condensation protein B
MDPDDPTTSDTSSADPLPPELDPRLLARLAAEAHAGSAEGLSDLDQDDGHDESREASLPAQDRGAPRPHDAPADEAPPSLEQSGPEPSGPEPEEDPELAGLPLAVRVEAALFAATEPLPLRRLKEVVGCADGRRLRDVLDALAAGYESRGQAFVLQELAAGFQLRTRGELAPVVQRLGRRTETEKLSPAALETLAVVAYRQPVLRAAVEQVRGVACGEVLRSLTERGLVRVAGRAELPGSPLLYGTTARFLEVFGLRDLTQLPRDAQLARPAPQAAASPPTSAEAAE